MPWRPTAKKLLLNKNTFARKFLLLFTAESVDSVEQLLLGSKQRYVEFCWDCGTRFVFTSPSKGLFHHFKHGQSFINGIWLHCKCLDDVINVSQKTCMIEVSFPQTCRDLQLSYVPSAAHLSMCWFGSAIPGIRPASFAPVQFHKYHNLINVKYEEEGEREFSFLSQWSVWAVMAFTCWDKSSNTPHLKWPRCRATVPTVCTITAV